MTGSWQVYDCCMASAWLVHDMSKLMTSAWLVNVKSTYLVHRYIARLSHGTHTTGAWQEHDWCNGAWQFFWQIHEHWPMWVMRCLKAVDLIVPLPSLSRTLHNELFFHELNVMLQCHEITSCCFSSPNLLFKTRQDFAKWKIILTFKIYFKNVFLTRGMNHCCVVWYST